MVEQVSGELKDIKIPDVIPVLSLFNLVVYPHMTFPLEVTGERAIKLVDGAMADDRLIGFVMGKKALTEDELPGPDDIHQVGTLVVILKMAKTAENKAQMLVQGITRFSITELVEGKPYLQARITTLANKEAKGIKIEALMANLVNLFNRVVKLSPFLPQEVGALATTIKEPGALADMIATLINADSEEKQKVLETLDVKKRLEQITRVVSHQLEILELGNKIQTQVKDDLDKGQREYFLRQQLKAIKEELGEGEEESKVEIEEYRSKIEELELPEEAKKEAERELGRLSRMHPSSAEYTVASTYLDWMISLPWKTKTEDNLDIRKARKVLDEDHYGLEKPKKRIIEYLSVRKLKPDTKGPILCFAGPPGTGKTSLGASIARALGRKFIRISLKACVTKLALQSPAHLHRALPGRPDYSGARRADRTIPSSCWTRSTNWGWIFGATPHQRSWRSLIPNRIFHSAIIT